MVFFNVYCLLAWDQIEYNAKNSLHFSILFKISALLWDISTLINFHISHPGFRKLIIICRINDGYLCRKSVLQLIRTSFYNSRESSQSLVCLSHYLVFSQSTEFALLSDLGAFSGLHFMTYLFLQHYLGDLDTFYQMPLSPLFMFILFYLHMGINKIFPYSVILSLFN